MAVIPFATEAGDFDEADDEMLGMEADDEAAPILRRPIPIRTPIRGNNVPPRPQPGFATRAELTATANRLDSKIGTLSSGVKTLETRARTLDTEQGKLRVDLKKEQTARQNLSGQLNNLTQISMLLPLLSSQSTVTTTAAVGGIPDGTKVVVDSGNKFTQLLPILLLSGMMGSPSGTQSSGGMFGDSNSTMMLAMFFALSK